MPQSDANLRSARLIRDHFNLSQWISAIGSGTIRWRRYSWATKLKDVHWQSPTIMYSAFVTGILLAAGHHFFYNRLNGSLVPSSHFIGSISYQEANIALGTAFAFGISACFVCAVNIAYIQVFWGVNRPDKKTDTMSIKDLDCLFSTSNDVVSLLNASLWPRFPVLFALSALSWLIPVASVFTPATLSTRSGPVRPAPHELMQVPTLDFASLNFVADMRFEGNRYNPPDPEPAVSFYPYSGAHSDVQSVTNAVMSTGSISPISPPGVNVTWKTQFHGPVLKCSNVSEASRLEILENIVYGYGSGGNLNPSCGVYITQYKYQYFAWSPRTVYPEGGEMLPFLPKHGSDYATFSTGSMRNTGNVGRITEPTIFFTTIPDPSTTKDILCSPEIGKGDKDRTKLINDLREAFTGTALQCKLHNSTYQVSFKYRSQNQSVSIEVPHVNPIPEQSMKWYVSGPTQPFVDRHEGQQTPIGEVPASACVRLYDGGINGEVRHSGECGTVDQEMLRSLSYQAVFEAFWKNVKGSIQSGADVSRADLWTGVLGTVLKDTLDLQFLKTIQPWAPTVRSLKQELMISEDRSVQGLVNYHDLTPQRTLAETIEELFLNVTVSLMSVPALQPNYSSIFAPQPSNVTTHTYDTVYSYSPEKLWLAYGIVLGLTSVAVAVGFEAMAENSASYSNNFSTILRAARGAHLNTALLPEYLGGEDPCPDYILKAKVQFMGKRTSIGDGSPPVDLVSLPTRSSGS